MRLFIKLFGFFLLILFVVGTSLETSGILARYYEERWQGVLHAIMPMEAEKAARMFETSGPDALRDYLDNLQAQKSVRFYFFDGDGNSLLGRGAPEQVLKLAASKQALRRTEQQNLSLVNPRQGLALRLVQGPSGKDYVLAFQQSPTLILPVSDAVGAHPYIRLLTIGLFGAALCFFLTRHITKPIASLSAAAGGIAAGRLQTRVAPGVRRRHDEIAQLGRDFDRMAEQIEALVTAQRELLGDVSHELRSPLARLIVALTLLRHSPPEEAHEYLTRIGIEADRLDKLIGQLLTLTRIESGMEMRTDNVDLLNLIQEVVADSDFEARAHKRAVMLTSTESCPLTGAVELLRSAIENVMRNAVRHTREGTTVEVSLERKAAIGKPVESYTPWTANVAGSIAVLRVRDYGSGVPKEKLHEMFLPFWRLPETASENGSSDSGQGAGLGLAIAERVVRMHQGKIRAHNAPDRGLIVEIELPL